MQKPLRTLGRFTSAVLGLAFGLCMAELTFGGLRPQDAPAGAVLYSVEVRDAEGVLLASPLVVGREGEKVHLSLSQPVGPHSEPLQMALDLDPQNEARGLCVGYQLSLDQGAPYSGRIGLGYGERRSVRLLSAGEDLQLSLTVARAHTRAFDKILRNRRRTAS